MKKWLILPLLFLTAVFSLQAQQQTVKGVATIAELRLLNPNDPTTKSAFVYGDTVILSGGGMYVWNPTSVSAESSPDIIISSKAVTGRWYKSPAFSPIVGADNTASSVGSGWKLTAEKVGVDLRFNTLTNDSTLVTTSNNNSIIFGIANNGVGDSQIRQGSANSVIGRSANGPGNVADIAAAADNTVLKRTNGVVVFGKVSLVDDVVGVLQTANIGAHSHAASDISSGTLDDARIPSGITRDSEWDTSAKVAVNVADETGTGPLVFANKPTINSTQYTPVNHGSVTTFRIDPNYAEQYGTATGNFTFLLDTNSVTAGIPSEEIRVQVYDAAGGKTAALSSSGTGGTDFSGGEKNFGWGTNMVAAGTNTYYFFWDGKVWHHKQDTAQISAIQIGSGAVTDAQFGNLSTTGTPTFAGLKIGSVLTNAFVSLGSGDDLNYVPSAGQALPYWIEIRQGTSGSPFTNSQPLVKMVRVEQMDDANMVNGTANEQNTIINLQSLGVPGTKAQVNPIYAVAQSSSTNARTSTINPDAMGGGFTGRIVTNGVGRGIGIYGVGRTDSATGLTDGAEIRSWNNSGVEGLYNASGNSDYIALLLNSYGNSNKQSSVAIQVNTGTGTSGSQFHAFIGLPKIGTSNTVSGYILIEDQASTNGLVLAGQHTQAFSTGASAGTVSIGRTNNTPVNSGALLEVYKSGSQDPLVALQGNNATDLIGLKVGNGAGSSRYFVSGGTDNNFTGTAQGDVGIVIGTTNKVFHIGGSGNTSIMEVKNSGSAGQVSWFNGAPVSKQDTDVETALINYNLLTSSPLAGPQNNITVYDEFLNAVAGAFEWSTGVSGTGALWQTTTATGARPGIVQFASGTATNSMSGIRTSGSTILFGGGRQILKTAVRVPTLSDGTETFTVFIGYHDVNGSTGEAVDGVYFAYSSSTTYYVTNTSVGSWVGKTASNSSRSETSPSAAITANQWYNLTIDVNAAGSQADFYIDGVLLGSLTTNIPTSANRNTAIGYKIEKQAGTTARNLDADYCWWNFKPTAAR